MASVLKSPSGGGVASIPVTPSNEGVAFLLECPSDSLNRTTSIIPNRKI